MGVTKIAYRVAGYTVGMGWLPAQSDEQLDNEILKAANPQQSAKPYAP